MPDSVAPLGAVILAAGAGTRLRPLTRELPKALCPLANRALVDHKIDSVLPVVGQGSVAVNLHHGSAPLEEHLSGRVHLSHEEPLLGTAGAVAGLRSWLGDRAALTVNADTLAEVDLRQAVSAWDGERPLVIHTGPGRFGSGVGVIAAITPWSVIAALPEGPAGLYESVWAPAAAAGRLQELRLPGAVFFDCGTPSGYLRANLHLSGGANVIGEGAEVAGQLDRCVIWPGAKVRRGEYLSRSVRTTGGLTVLVREW